MYFRIEATICTAIKLLKSRETAQNAISKTKIRVVLFRNIEHP